MPIELAAIRGTLVEGVSEKLQRASAQMGAAADVDLIAAMEAEALALLREAAAAAAAAAEDADAPEAEPAAPEAEAAAPDGEAAAPEAAAAVAGGAKGAPVAQPSSDAPGVPAEHDPPPKEPPDG